MIPETREHLSTLARHMASRGLTDGTSGNISLLDEQTGHIAVTPSAMPYQEMTGDQIVVLDGSGGVVWGDCSPTSEFRMHLAVLAGEQSIKAVIHTHSRFAIAMACIHQELPAITVDMAAYCGPTAPVVPYLTPGSEELAAAVSEYIGAGHRAVLLANHGALFVSPDPELLIDGAEALELAAMAYLRGSVAGTPVPIPEPEVNKLLDLVYGHKRAV